MPKVSTPLFAKLLEYTKDVFEHTDGSHDWEHTQRVLTLARHIAKLEGADIEIVEIATILHDIGRSAQDKSKGKVCHAELGANMAEKILQSFEVPDDKIQKIIHCIGTHRFRGNNFPETLEAKVLFDADKLDGIGAVGIGRAFLFAGEHHAKLHDPNPNLDPNAEYTKEDTAYREYTVKLQKIKDKVYTAEGKRLAQERHDFMEIFFHRLNEEVKGEI
ncbi:phosphohydrolase [Candidatus Gracilibacteria bacterium CG_4_9_14_0_2_um_filter_38_7]|nr:MAG: phosphohydrolase [Candidatus Gracilibacteria bacterium CG1_02_38_174]PIQ11568.1 MAG: phosphohydrolase [Candidatus Gracilibacteria bacterium CG18_big_fil_WC_8_21_14_2_50_38_16]PIQ42304.1 MAG: phosphohydrolase [Candidatus Gracilibacteria bacterium CG12_big_fil_rev_8_21_14_0_65_38_15]PIZ02088.1 MAG: phosphohydrolase [Candidatus Gracilibacteria bacterium CG_4_10_14_0_8_um_filter_38_28]PJC56879.1 MAG: phosphohydrolase [Candidatus Gracilibacteria bacterium CG_4_9_14_0_2_um_filter_38_7]